MGLRNSLVYCAVVAAVLGAGAQASRADTVPVADPGFTSPDASTSPGSFYTLPGTPGGWNAPDLIGTPLEGAIGVFYNNPDDPFNPGHPNPLFITNMQSSQSAYISNVPGLYLSQDVTGIGSTYQVGTPYKLRYKILASDDTVPIAGAVPDGAPFQSILYYGGNPANVVGTISTGAGVLQKDQTLLYNVELDIPAVLNTDAWAGQQIGVMFDIPLSATPGGVWDVTDVYLEAVPEPASLTLLGVGAAGLLGRRRRRVA